MHLFVAVLYDWWIPRIWHEISAFLFCSFGFQILSKSSVPVFFFLFSEEFWCFVYCDLNLVSLMPYYILFLSFSVIDVIFALYKTLLLRNILFKGHFDFLIQLHPLAWADGCRFVTVILCMLICEPNGWTGFWVMGFYRKVVPSRTQSFICMGVENMFQSWGLVF